MFCAIRSLQRPPPASIADVNPMPRAVFGLGANLDDGQALSAAIKRFQRHPDLQLICSSPRYHSTPWGGAAGGRYQNLALLVQTELKPWQLIGLALDIERQLGRLRGPRYAPRGIDIDLLWYQGAQLDTPGAKVPHPRLLQRRFALQPLVDVAPQATLATGLNARMALLRCPDSGPLWRSDDDDDDSLANQLQMDNIRREELQRRSVKLM